MSDPENRDPWEVPPATHPGEVYEVRVSRSTVSMDCGAGYTLFFNPDVNVDAFPEDLAAVLRRLVHCRNLVDGPDAYAEHYETVEHPGLDADIAAVCGDLDERLARRIAERVEAWMDAKYANTELPLEEGPRAELLAICREEVARWAEPDEQDAPPARPDASVSHEDADRGGE